MYIPKGYSSLPDEMNSPWHEQKQLFISPANTTGCKHHEVIVEAGTQEQCWMSLLLLSDEDCSQH